MKFSNGYWLYRDGVKLYGAVEIRDVTITPTKVSLFVTPFKVETRGDTLTGPLLTIEITSPLEDVLTVNAYHYKGNLHKAPSFQITNTACALTANETDESINIYSGMLTVTIHKKHFEMIYTYDGRFLTKSDYKQLGYLTTPDGAFFRERLDISVDEQFYGLGERFTPFVKNGQSVDIWNEDGGTASEQAYKNVPFFVSSRGYGVFVNHTGNISFEIGSEAVSKTQFSVKGESLQYSLIGGKDMKTIISKYTDMTGKPALPPAWSFGLWLSTSFTTEYNEETIIRFIDGMAERDIPLSVFHFDCFWMKEYEWCNFTWDTDQFPEPEAMLKRLKERGLHICVWINPYIGQKSPLFDDAADKGYLLMKADGSVRQFDSWQPGMGIVDFTNPQAVKWYQKKLSALVDMGVDCFKTDFGERIPTDVSYADGSTPEMMHNYYTYLYNKTVFEVLRKSNENDAVVFARSATAGCQQFPVHWGGDCEATYASMSESLRGGLSLALCGFGFWSHDIGGFESTATADLYKRWIAFGLFSTHSRLHGSGSYRVPWLFDEESVDVLRFFVKLKCSLMPYIWTQSINACKTGIPVMRPMVMEFHGDRVCKMLDTQYMFGSDILVAPIFREDGICEYYLPVGHFTHLLSGKEVTGGKYITGVFDYFSLPVYVRENSMIVMGKDIDTGYDYSDCVEVHVYRLMETRVLIYDNKGCKKAEIIGRNLNGKVQLLINGDIRDIRFVFHNAAVKNGNGFETRRNETNFTVFRPYGVKEIEIEIEED